MSVLSEIHDEFDKIKAYLEGRFGAAAVADAGAIIESGKSQVAALLATAAGDVETDAKTAVSDVAALASEPASPGLSKA